MMKVILSIAIQTWCQQLPLDEAYYKIAYLRERRDSYLAVRTDYSNQRNQMIEARVKEKITVITEAIMDSKDFIAQFNIPLDQFNAMLVNKKNQYDNVVAVEKELDALIAFTNSGFNQTYNNLKKLNFVSCVILSYKP